MASLYNKSREERGRILRNRMNNNNNNNNNHQRPSTSNKKITSNNNNNTNHINTNQTDDEHKHDETSKSLNINRKSSRTDAGIMAGSKDKIQTYILNKDGTIKKSINNTNVAITNRALRAFPNAFVVLKIKSRKKEKISPEQKAFLESTNELFETYTFCYGKEDGTKSYWINKFILSPEDFRKWHFNGKFKANNNDNDSDNNAQVQKMSLNKYYSRLSLAFSNSVSSKVLNKETGYNIVEINDIYNDENDVSMEMTDGCGVISVDIIKESIMPLLDIHIIPSAIQVRYGSYKGMLLVDQSETYLPNGKTITFCNSMSKYDLPLEHADDLQQCLDIVGYAHPKFSCTLNEQVILVYLGRSDMAEASNIILNILELNLISLKEMYDYEHGNILSLKAHLKTNGDNISVYTPNLLPNLLQAGIDNDYFVSRLIYQQYLDILKKLKEKLHINIENARIVYCIPDFFGILNENEFYYKDSQHGIINKKAFILRNPCHHPMDLVQLNGVNFCGPYNNTNNVIVFSTKGNRSTASKCSGGDYDGDRVFVCWDNGLNEAIKRTTEKAPSHTDPRVKKIQYSTLSKPYPHDKVYTKETTEKMKALYIKSISGECSKLGEVSNLWKESCVEYGTNHERSLKLAKLCAYYVDMEKYGLQNKELEPWVTKNKKNPSRRKAITLIDEIKNRIQRDIDSLEKHSPPLIKNKNLVKLAEMFHWTKYEVEAKKLLKEYNKDLAIIINDNNEDQRKRNELEFELHSKHTKKIREFLHPNGIILPGDFNKSLALAIYMVCYDEKIYSKRKAGKQVPYEYCWAVAAKFLCRLHADYLEPNNTAGVAHTICNENVLRGVKIMM